MPFLATPPGRHDSTRDGYALSSENQDARSAWLVSLAFWLSLFTSVAFYASVALSPKLAVYLDLKSRYYENQVQLVDLERQIERLGRVAQAFEHEVDFSAELARIDFDAHRPGDERIAVEADLQLDARAVSRSSAFQSKSSPWYEKLTRRMATDRKLRALLLTTAAISVVLAFTILHESQEHFGIRPARPLLNWIARRYQTPAGD